MLARILTSIRRLSSGVLTLLAAAAMVLVAVEPAHADATSAFTPGKAWTDSSGRTLQMHGLGIVEVGSAWYAFGENKTGEFGGHELPVHRLLPVHRPVALDLPTYGAEPAGRR